VVVFFFVDSFTTDLYSQVRETMKISSTLATVLVLGSPLSLDASGGFQGFRGFRKPQRFLSSRRDSYPDEAIAPKDGKGSFEDSADGKGFFGKKGSFEDSNVGKGLTGKGLEDNSGDGKGFTEDAKGRAFGKKGSSENVSDGKGSWGDDSGDGKGSLSKGTGDGKGLYGKKGLFESSSDGKGSTGQIGGKGLGPSEDSIDGKGFFGKKGSLHNSGGGKGLDDGDGKGVFGSKGSLQSSGDGKGAIGKKGGKGSIWADDDDDSESSGDCVICDKSNKVSLTSLTFIYFSDGADSRYQDKAECREDNYPSSTVVTFLLQGRQESFSVSNGERFTVDGPFRANTQIEIIGYGHPCSIHTSCSQPLVVGDRIGPFELVSAVPSYCDDSNPGTASPIILPPFDSPSTASPVFPPSPSEECVICDCDNKITPLRGLEIQYISNGETSKYQTSANCKRGMYPATATLTFHLKYGSVIIPVTDGKKFLVRGVFEAETYIEVQGFDEDCFIDTSCTEALVVGDQIGPFRILGAPQSECEKENPSMPPIFLTPSPTTSTPEGISSVPSTEPLPTLAPFDGCIICDETNKNFPLEALELQYKRTGAKSEYQDSASCGEGVYPIAPNLIFEFANGNAEVPAYDGFQFIVVGDFLDETNVQIEGFGECSFITSCSEPLVVGDQIGPFVIIGAVNSDCDKTSLPSPVPTPTGTPQISETPTTSISPSKNDEENSIPPITLSSENPTQTPSEPELPSLLPSAVPSTEKICQIDVSITCEDDNGVNCDDILEPPFNCNDTGCADTVTFTYIGPTISSRLVCVNNVASVLVDQNVVIGEQITVPSSANDDLSEILTCQTISNGQVEEFQIDTCEGLSLKNVYGDSLRVESCDEKNCLVPITYTYTIENIGTTEMEITELERTRDGTTEDLIGLVEDTSLAVSETTTATEEEVLDICIEGEITTTVEVVANPPEGEPCLDEEDYSIVVSATPLPTNEPSSSPSEIGMPSNSPSETPTNIPSNLPSLSAVPTLTELLVLPFQAVLCV